jgi:hypothetical protein
VFHDIDAETYTSTYGIARDAADRLLRRVVVIRRPNPDRPEIACTKTCWVAAVACLPDQGCARVSVASRILPYRQHLALLGVSIKQVVSVSPAAILSRDRASCLRQPWLGAVARY